MKIFKFDDETEDFFYTEVLTADVLNLVLLIYRFTQEVKKENDEHNIPKIYAFIPPYRRQMRYYWVMMEAQ